jgi:hypothetical protein
MDTVAEIERSGSRQRGAGAGGRILQSLRKFFFAAGTIAVLVVVQSLRLASAEPVALSEPPNVGDAQFAAVAYYKSGAYERDLAAVASLVSARLAERAPQVSRAALVLDIDDTVLSNWEVIMADDFGRVFEGPCRSLPNGPMWMGRVGPASKDACDPPNACGFQASAFAGRCGFLHFRPG